MTKLVLLAAAMLTASIAATSAQEWRPGSQAPAMMGSPTAPLSGSTSGSTRYDSRPGRGSSEPAFNAVRNRAVFAPPPPTTVRRNPPPISAPGTPR